MANSLRWLLSSLGILLGWCASAQVCWIETDSAIAEPRAVRSTLYESRNGSTMTTSGMVRALVILIELEYHPDSTHRNPLPNGSAYWQPGTLPTWVDGPNAAQNLFDANPPVGDAEGLATRYFQLASSGNFTLLGDYLMAPGNGGVFKLFTTTGHFTTGNLSQLRDTINNQLSTISNNLLFENDQINDFDRWIMGTSTTGVGRPKEQVYTESPRKYDHVAVICLNCAQPWNRTGWAGGNIGSILGYTSNTYSVVGAHSRAPIEVFRHEFSHLLVGDNRFHCAGGGNTDGYPQYWISQSGGWAMMSLNNCSMLSWCGWDRQRMGWHNPLNSFLVSARDTTLAEVSGDLDAMVPADTGIYVLRDFTLTGDAIRIKLPYTDSVSEYPEFIWVENHQGYNMNNVPFDRWQYEELDCVVDVAPGLYMYMQIDRDLREDSTLAMVYPIDGYDDYLRPLVASGHFDMTFTEEDVNAPCLWAGMTPAFIRSIPNPLTGVGDTHWAPVDRNNDGIISKSGNDFRRCRVEYADGSYHDNGFSLGHARHGFRSEAGGNTKLGIATNPSSASMMNIVGQNGNVSGAKNHRRIQLNGISIEMLAQNPDGSIKVKVRFDDVDVNNDARWCADEIQLNPVATSTGYSLNVTSGKTITLDRGTAATRRNAPETWNGQPVFTSATLMRCPASTWLNLAAGGGFTVDNGSTLRLESGSRMDVGNGAVLRVKRGGKLELMGGSVLNVLPGGQVIIEEDWPPANHGRLVYHQGARINLEGSNAVLEFAGVLDIQPNAVFTVGRSSDPGTTLGLVKFTNSLPVSNTVTAGANSRFILRSTSVNNRILHVEQESLYGPASLVEFTLGKAKATLANNARIVPPVSNGCAINFTEAMVTSPTGVRNTHRGVRLNGQAGVNLYKSTFSKGAYGAYSYNTNMGNGLAPYQCSFIDCGTGLYNYDKGIAAVNCKFDQCGNGRYASNSRKQAI